MPARPPGPPETEFVLLASRAGTTPAHTARLAELAERVEDWERVARLAHRHAVAQLVERHLAALPPPPGAPHAPPPPASPESPLPNPAPRTSRVPGPESRSTATAVRNLVLTGHLVDVVEAFRVHGIECIPIKGPVLALSVYGDLALRRFGDIDLLVRRADIPRAKEVLAALGYRLVADFSGASERALERSDYHVAYASAEDGAKLELHWALTRDVPGTHVDERWAWRNAREVTLLGRRIPALSWEALLVYLAIHGTKHQWAQLGWVVDVAELLRAAPAIDWGAAESLARETGARRMLPLALVLARDLLEAPLPDEAIAMVRAAPAAVRRLAARVEARLFDERWDGMTGAVSFQLRALERPSHRAAYLAHLLTAPHVADVEAMPLPAPLAPLYRLLRPARLLGKRLARPASRG